jgi:hypothetical protein
MVGLTGLGLGASFVEDTETVQKYRYSINTEMHHFIKQLTCIAEKSDAISLQMKEMWQSIVIDTAHLSEIHF